MGLLIRMKKRRKETCEMDKIIPTLESVLPVIITLFWGVLMRKKKLMTAQGIADLKSLIVNVCIPAAMFVNFYSTDLSGSVAILLLLMMATMIAAYVIGLLLKKALHIQQEFMPYLCTTIEGGMLGYALYILLFGQENLYHMALIDLGTAFFLFGYLITKLRLRSEPSVTGKDILKGFTTPINIAIILGLGCNLLGIGRILNASAAGDLISSICSFASAPVGFLILICVGFGLDFSNVPWGVTMKTILSRVVVMACAGVLGYQCIIRLFPGDDLYRYGMLLAFVLPPSYAFSAYTKGEEENSYVGSVLAVYLVITVIGYSLIAWAIA